jgi:hypothetical protein
LDATQRSARENQPTRLSLDARNPTQNWGNRPDARITIQEEFHGSMPEKLVQQKSSSACNMSAVPITIHIEEGVESGKDLQGLSVAGNRIRYALHCARKICPGSICS